MTDFCLYNKVFIMQIYIIVCKFYSVLSRRRWQALFPAVSLRALRGLLRWVRNAWQESCCLCFPPENCCIALQRAENTFWNSWKEGSAAVWVPLLTIMLYLQILLFSVCNYWGEVRAKEQRHWQQEEEIILVSPSANRAKHFKFVNCFWSEQTLLKMCIEIHAWWRVRNLTFWPYLVNCGQW